MDWLEGVIHPPQPHSQRQHHRVDGLRQKEVGHALDIANNATTLRHNHRHYGEAIIQQHQLRDRACCRRPIAHGHTQICRFQCQHIIDTITGHRHMMSARLQRMDHIALVLRRNTTKDLPRLHNVRKLVANLGALSFATIIAAGRKLRGIDRIVSALHFQLTRNSPHRAVIVTRNDLDLNTFFIEVGHRLRCI